AVRRWPDQAAVELRRAGAGPAGLALRHDGDPRERRHHARRHDRGAQVHRPPLRRGLLRRREAEAAAVSLATGDAAFALGPVREGDPPGPPRGAARLVAAPAIQARFWPAITRRQSPPSPLPRLLALAAGER